FARALTGMESEIRKVPNLIVLSASAEDQRSWASEEARRTVFAHYFLEGLKGGADKNNDGRIDAWELHQFTAAAVERWVRVNREALQTPVLLPSGDEGEKRARAMHVTLIEKTYQARDLAPGASWSPPSELRQAWQRAKQLADSKPFPGSILPHKW